jgi:hypothetical protein
VTELAGRGGGWHLLDLVVIGCVGVLVGLLVAAVAARDRLPSPDTPEGINRKE